MNGTPTPNPVVVSNRSAGASLSSPVSPLKGGVAASPNLGELGNLEHADKFLEALAGDSLITFQTFDDKGKNRALSRILHGPLSKHLEELTDLNRKGAGIYVMVNEGNGKGRTEENVKSVRALILDLDGSPLDPVLLCPLKPHILTETSSGRYQCFWLVKDFPLDKGVISLVQGDICERFGGDPKVTKDLSRVMRVPGFYHKKKEPYLSRLLDTLDLAPYSEDEVLRTLDINLTVSKKKPAPLPSKAPDGQIIPEHYRNCTSSKHGGFNENKGIFPCIN